MIRVKIAEIKLIYSEIAAISEGLEVPKFSCLSLPFGGLGARYADFRLIKSTQRSTHVIWLRGHHLAKSGTGLHDINLFGLTIFW